jgi:hypothetical protein
MKERDWQLDNDVLELDSFGLCNRSDALQIGVVGELLLNRESSNTHKASGIRVSLTRCNQHVDL